MDKKELCKKAGLTYNFVQQIMNCHHRASLNTAILLMSADSEIKLEHFNY